MKLQNLAVIFIIIVLPILLITSYYLSVQIDTIDMQANYNIKLTESTKEAIDAFEINTTEWNANYSETADSKRRDVMASINTFTTSLANNLGVAGTSKDYMLSRIPAIAFTLYDGYYIYTPADTKITLKDDKGVSIHMSEKIRNVPSGEAKLLEGYDTDDASNDDKILYEVEDGKPSDGKYYKYKKNEEGEIEETTTIEFTLNPDNAKTENKHILKPFTSYSEQLTEDIVINYTLDNYVTLYGNLPDTGGTNTYFSKSGYLTVPKKIGIKFDKLTSISAEGGIKGIEFEGNSIKPEKLQEQVAYTDDEQKYYVGTFYYVYESESNIKLYYDAAKKEFFKLDNKSKRVYMSALPTELYKKCTVPVKKGTSGEDTYMVFYQSLENKEDGTFDLTWYQKDEASGKIYKPTAYNPSDLGLKCTSQEDILYDYSDVNYYVESFLFTTWVNSIASDKGIDFLQINESNDPDPATNKEANSAFEAHKIEIIKNVVESNLNQAITAYSRKSTNVEYYLPKITDTEWDQILKNASIITFLQNIPIGTKYYNDYAIATSSLNKEYVDPEEIYLNASGEEYYHMPYCSKLGEKDLIGFRSIDYIQKSYIKDLKEAVPKTLYYYKHHNNPGIKINVKEACYECLVQKSLYKADSKTANKQTAYFTALGRERYIARYVKLPAQVESQAHIYVETFDITQNKETSSAKFSVETNGVAVENKIDTIIPKNTPNNTTYKVKALIDKKMVDPALVVNQFGNGNIYDVSAANPEKFSTYESDSEATITIVEYKNNMITYGITTAGVVTETQFGGAYEPKIYDHNPGQLSLDMDAYINIRLNYQQNYESSGGEIKSVWANINKYNELIVATKVSGINGKVRLKFENGGNIFYTDKIFDLQNEGEHEIYCRIPGEQWYTGDWKVSIVAVDNAVIEGPKAIEYYTIENKGELQDFAAAVNGTKGITSGANTESRKFYLVGDVNLNNESIQPIAQKETKRFQGLFSGQYNITYDDQGISYKQEAATSHTISNVQITGNNNQYDYGLFGGIGPSGQVEHIAINNIVVKYTGNSDAVQVGGLAGYCDTGSTIKNININGGTIQGRRYVGGLIGQSYRAIDNCNVSNLTSITGTGDSGGIVGNAGNKISNCKVSGVGEIKGEQSKGGIARIYYK